MSKPSNTLTLTMTRRLANQCTRCGADAVKGRQLCQPHIDDQRRRTRAANAKRRTARRKTGRCIDCGKASSKQRCPKCWKKSRGEHKRTEGEHKPDDADSQWRCDPGTTWNRFRGKGRRGRLTREEQIEEDARDARFAIAEIEKFIASLSVLQRPEVQDLPRIQRDAAKRVPAQYLGTAGRFLDELADKYSG